MNAIRQPRRQGGSFIIEAIISLILFGIGIVALLGLVTQALNQTGQSKARNDASYAAGELIAEMWVSASINIDAWANRVRGTATTTGLIPGATPSVYFATCDCADTGSNACAASALKTGTQAVANPQAVTVCISWTDAKDPTNPRRYQSSSMITRN